MSFFVCGLSRPNYTTMFHRTLHACCQVIGIAKDFSSRMNTIHTADDDLLNDRNSPVVRPTNIHSKGLSFDHMACINYFSEVWMY